MEKTEDNKKKVLAEIKKSLKEREWFSFNEEPHIVKEFNNVLNTVISQFSVVKTLENEIKNIEFILELIFLNNKEIDVKVTQSILNFMNGYNSEHITEYCSTFDLLKIYNKIFTNRILDKDDNVILSLDKIDTLFASENSYDEYNLKKNEVNDLIFKSLVEKLKGLNFENEDALDIVRRNKQTINRFVRGIYPKMKKEIKFQLAILAYKHSKDINVENDVKFDITNSKEIKKAKLLFKSSEMNLTFKINELLNTKNEDVLALLMSFQVFKLSQQQVLQNIVSNDWFISGFDELFQANKHENFLNTIIALLNNSGNELVFYVKDLIFKKNQTKFLCSEQSYSKIFINEYSSRTFKFNLDIINKMSQSTSLKQNSILCVVDEDEYSISISNKSLIVNINNEIANLVKYEDIAKIIIDIMEIKSKGTIEAGKLEELIKQKFHALFLYLKMDDVHIERENKSKKKI